MINTNLSTDDIRDTLQRVYQIILKAADKFDLETSEAKRKQAESASDIETTNESQPEQSLLDS